MGKKPQEEVKADLIRAEEALRHPSPVLFTDHLSESLPLLQAIIRTIQLSSINARFRSSSSILLLGETLTLLDFRGGGSYLDSGLKSKAKAGIIGNKRQQEFLNIGTYTWTNGCSSHGYCCQELLQRWRILSCFHSCLRTPGGLV